MSYFKEIKGEEWMKKCCPNCFVTSFSVAITAFQEYDSELDEWYSVEEVEGIDETQPKPYLCRNCGEMFELEELIQIKGEEWMNDEEEINSQIETQKEIIEDAQAEIKYLKKQIKELKEWGTGVQKLWVRFPYS